HALSMLRTRAALEPNLGLVLEVLGSRGLNPVVLKGAALAYAYPKPQYRTLGDIDLLLPEHAIGSADEALRANGYQAMDVDLGHGHQHLAPYLSPDGYFVIELHHTLVPDENPYRLDVPSL